MKHIFQKGAEDKPTFLLLHGTGGTEHDLVSLGKFIDKDANILSVRGNVTENGMARFFKRLAEGVFDEEDLVLRTKELLQFIDEAAEKYAFNREKVIAIGYSNGANIAASLVFHHEHALSGAILHHPMVPRRGISLPSLEAVPVFIGAGRNDPMCAASESEELALLLEQAGANVNVHWENNGHSLTQTEVEAAKIWYHQNNEA